MFQRWRARFYIGLGSVFRSDSSLSSPFCISSKRVTLRLRQQTAGAGRLDRCCESASHHLCRALNPLCAIFAEHCHAPTSNTRIHTFKLPGLEQFQRHRLNIWKHHVRELHWVIRTFTVCSSTHGVSDGMFVKPSKWVLSIRTLQREGEGKKNVPITRNRCFCHCLCMSLSLSVVTVCTW